MIMSSKKSLRKQVEQLALFANNSKDLDNVIEEVLNFVRNQKRKAISDFLTGTKRTKLNEGFFSKGEGKTSTELSER